jgi:hypothetical protein
MISPLVAPRPAVNAPKHQKCQPTPALDARTNARSTRAHSMGSHQPHQAPPIGTPPLQAQALKVPNRLSVPLLCQPGCPSFNPLDMRLKLPAPSVHLICTLRVSHPDPTPLTIPPQASFTTPVPLGFPGISSLVLAKTCSFELTSYQTCTATSDVPFVVLHFGDVNNIHPIPRRHYSFAATYLEPNRFLTPSCDLRYPDTQAATRPVRGGQS